LRLEEAVHLGATPEQQDGEEYERSCAAQHDHLSTSLSVKPHRSLRDS
jgi:hypothetical protein